MPLTTSFWRLPAVSGKMHLLMQVLEMHLLMQLMEGFICFPPTALAVAGWDTIMSNMATGFKWSLEVGLKLLESQLRGDKTKIIGLQNTVWLIVTMAYSSRIIKKTGQMWRYFCQVAPNGFKKDSFNVRAISAKINYQSSPRCTVTFWNTVWNISPLVSSPSSPAINCSSILKKSDFQSRARKDCLKQGPFCLNWQKASFLVDLWFEFFSWGQHGS